MTDFLLELLSEEIPARMQGKAKEDLARLFTEHLTKAGLKADSVETFATPRRLALIAKGLPLETEAVSEETKGPKVGAPPQALEGFLRKVGLTQGDLVERDGIYFAVVNKPGRKTADVLGEAIPAIIRAFPWPKSMRWGKASISTESLRWVRPLQGIVALLGDEVVPSEIDGITSGRNTVGHRFHSSGPVSIANAGAYIETLRDAHVIVHFSERCGIIRDTAKSLAADKGLVWIEDEALVAENAGLTEWPVPLIGDFDPAFLEVPREVIQLTLATNQKYFVCADKSGKLAPAFICTANIIANDGGEAIVAGNRKVLAARLSDARFFWEQDQKKTLEQHAEGLKRITFHEKLGTVADKVERVATLAEWLATEGIVPGADPKLARQAAKLAKADLVTEMVGEFPELQGVMGGYYAAKEGLPAEVSNAIRDHYKPVGQGDDVPTAPVTVAVSLADKLDTLVSFFVEGMHPTGSKDPFALRRSALAVIRLIIENSLRISLNDYLTDSIEDHFGERWSATTGRRRDNRLVEALRAGDPDFDVVEDETGLYLVHGSERILPLNRQYFTDPVNWADRIDQVWASHQHLLDFLVDRLKVQQRDEGVRHDIIDAAVAVSNSGFGSHDLVLLLARVKALQAFIGTDDGVNLLAGYKRAANLLKQADPDSVRVEPSRDTDAQTDLSTSLEANGALVQEERNLLAALDAAEPKAAAAIEAEEFEAAMAALASLRAPIDAFFDGVMVNDPDPDKRAFRLGLLARVRDAVNRVADFSKIEG